MKPNEISEEQRGWWIERERELRQRGSATALTQSQHAAANARYPGLTLQYCDTCGEPTGKGDGEAICSECEHERGEQ